VREGESGCGYVGGVHAWSWAGIGKVGGMLVDGWLGALLVPGLWIDDCAAVFSGNGCTGMRAMVVEVGEQNN